MLYLRTAVTFVGVGVCLCVVVKGLMRKKTPVTQESKIDPSPLNLTLKLESLKQRLCFAGLQSTSASNKGTRKRMIPKEDIDILIPIIAKNYTLFPNVLPPEELGLLLEDLKHVRWTRHSGRVGVVMLDYVRLTFDTVTFAVLTGPLWDKVVETIRQAKHESQSRTASIYSAEASQTSPMGK